MERAEVTGTMGMVPVVPQENNNEGESLIIRGGTMGKGKVEVSEIPLNKIKLAKNSRLNVSDEEIAGLMQSIKEQGMLQPIGVVKKGKGYEIVYGNRRFLAVSKLGKTKIPAVVHEYESDATDDLMNLTENLQRRNISLVEAGRYIALLRDQKLSYSEIAVRLGVGKTYVVTALEAYQRVPAKYRGDIDVSNTRTGKNMKGRGKIPLKAVKAILQTRKPGVSDAKTIDKLFELAKEDDRFLPENAMRYAHAIKSGAKDPIGEAITKKRVAVQFIMEEKEWNELYEKHVVKGKYKHLGAYFIDILKGTVVGRIKTIG